MNNIKDFLIFVCVFAERERGSDRCVSMVSI